MSDTISKPTTESTATFEGQPAVHDEVMGADAKCTDTGVESVSKKAAKKAEKNATKEAKRLVHVQQKMDAEAIIGKVVNDVATELFGYMSLEWSATSDRPTVRNFILAKELTDKHVGTDVWIRGRLQESRIQGPLGFLLCRRGFATVQLVLDGNHSISRDAVKWAGSVPLESIIDVYGAVQQPKEPIKSATQQVEIQVKKIFCVSKAATELPFQLKDASRPATSETAEDTITVGQEVRLDNRILDLRTQANQSIMRIQSKTCELFREHLLSQSFVEIHTPKLISGVSEGGANAFTLSYFGNPACLAQSPQLYKQMAISSDFDRVFEIAPVFRAENSNTHRHLCEFVGLDLEMAFYESYHEVLDVLDELFKHIFKGLSTRCSELIENVNKQYHAEPFKWTDKAPRLTYETGIEMLRSAGVTGIPDDTSSYDLSTEHEKCLGDLIKEKYGTDFYMLVRYPLGVRPFYTMPDPKDNKWSNSYDLFMRGEEIISGAQRVHCPELLTERAKAHGIDISTIKSYIDSFRLGSYPHGGAGIGLERVVMLFLGLGNIRKSSMFPRDPKRLTP